MTMFPQGPLVGTKEIPAHATFWMPRDDEIDGYGFNGGFLENTWLIKDVSIGRAIDVIDVERKMAKLAGRLANDDYDFERLASVAEFASVDDPDEKLTDAEREALREVVPDFPELEGLELGVSGLVHALAAVQILPAASCRSHPTSQSWSEAPVVLFAATEAAVRALQPLAEASGCTFAINPLRPDLLTVCGRSIANTMDLADAVMNTRAAFG